MSNRTKRGNIVWTDYDNRVLTEMLMTGSTVGEIARVLGRAQTEVASMVHAIRGSH
jgi:hypothetical protein